MNISIYLNKDIQFTKKFEEEFDAYPVENIRGTIVNIQELKISPNQTQRVYKVLVNYKKYDNYNRAFEKSNYYNDDLIPCLTAREANMYNINETIYMGCPEVNNWNEYFTLVSNKSTTLINEFNKSEYTNYVEWLESKIAVDTIDESQ